MHVKEFYISLLMSILLIQTSFSQNIPVSSNFNQDITWNKVFTDGAAGKVNRGLVDQDGNAAVIFMPDNQSRIHKIDGNTGNRIWTKTINNTVGFGITEIRDSGRSDYIVSGGAGSTQERWVARLNGDNGNTMWSKTYAYSGGGNQFDGVRMTIVGDDGYIYGAGFVRGDEARTIFVVYGGQAMLMKIDANTGNEIWTHTNTNTDYALAVVQDSNGELYYGSKVFDANLTLSKLNTSGTVSWTKQLSDTEVVIPADLAISSNNTIYFGGHSGRVGAGEPFDYTCIKLNTNADVNWVKHYANPRGYSTQYIRNELYGLKVKDQSIYLFGGSGDESNTYSENKPGYNSSDVWNGWVLITDLEGQMIRSDVFSHDNTNTATEYGDLTENGYVIFNDTDAFGDTEVGVIKVVLGDLPDDGDSDSDNDNDGSDEDDNENEDEDTGSDTNMEAYYVDAVNGNDNNSGSIEYPWQTLQKVSSKIFSPGESIYFKRGTSYNGSVSIKGNRTAQNPITVSAYGSGIAPSFTNPNYAVNNGNAMRVRGDFQIIENLHFHHTAPAPEDVESFEEVWEVGALHVSLGNDHVIIRNNEFAHVPKVIQSYSQHSLITENYIHDANSTQQNGFLSYPYWGPIGIQLGIGNQEVSHNRIENMYAEGGEYSADGGAIEVDDGRNHKNNIYIHHNTTYHNMGFLEVSYWDDIAFMESNNVRVEYNLSRDYQSFLLWWAPTHKSKVKNNTIIRDDNEIQGNWNAVFILDAPPGDIKIKKNIVVVDDEQTESIFIEGYDGAVDDVIHRKNCYWNVDGGPIDLGLQTGRKEIFADPLFVDYGNQNYYLQADSPAVGWGAFGVQGSASESDENLMITSEQADNKKFNKKENSPESRGFYGMEVNVFPNPTSDIINVQMGGQNDFTLNLLDLSGKLIAQAKNTSQLNISSVHDGVYLLEIKGSNSKQSLTKKIVVQK